MESGLGTYVTYNPFAVSLATRVDDLLQMVESMATHYFPVVDDQQRLIGVVSETDLMQLSRAATQPGCETDESRFLRTIPRTCATGPATGKNCGRRFCPGPAGARGRVHESRADTVHPA